jgi:hypothetical protein
MVRTRENSRVKYTSQFTYHAFIVFEIKRRPIVIITVIRTRLDKTVWVSMPHA